VIYYPLFSIVTTVADLRAHTKSSSGSTYGLSNQTLGKWWETHSNRSPLHRRSLVLWVPQFAARTSPAVVAYTGLALIPFIVGNLVAPV
jgi:hypothetical protein